MAITNKKLQEVMNNPRRQSNCGTDYGVYHEEIDSLYYERMRRLDDKAEQEFLKHQDALEYREECSNN